MDQERYNFSLQKLSIPSNRAVTVNFWLWGRQSRPHSILLLQSGPATYTEW